MVDLLLGVLSPQVSGSPASSCCISRLWLISEQNPFLGAIECHFHQAFESGRSLPSNSLKFGGHYNSLEGLKYGFITLSLPILFVLSSNQSQVIDFLILSVSLHCGLLLVLQYVLVPLQDRLVFLPVGNHWTTFPHSLNPITMAPRIFCSSVGLHAGTRTF